MEAGRKGRTVEEKLVADAVFFSADTGAGSEAFSSTAAGSGAGAGVETGGASRSISRAAGVRLGAGLSADGLALSDRLFIRGFSAVGWTKSNSTGSAPGLESGAGMFFSGMKEN